jgi:hypothetical protein
MVNAQDLADMVYYTLEPHAAYISRGDDDHVRYFVPQEILEVLAWIGLNVCVPILTGAAATLAVDTFKKNAKENSLKAMDVKAAELERLKTEVEAAMAKLQSRHPNSGQILIAQATLEEILSINGWPTESASKDARLSIDEIRKHLWPSG